MTMVKDPDRLRVSGSADARAVLTAADPIPPDNLRTQIRSAMEARFSPERAPRRWGVLLLGAGLLLGGTALAFGVVAVRARFYPPSPVVKLQPAAAPALDPPPAMAPPAADADQVRGNLGAVRPPSRGPMRPTAQRDQPFGGPALAWPPGRFGEQVDAPSRPAGPTTASAPAAPLLIAREGRRPIAIAIDGARIAGKVRDADIGLQIVGQRIIGKVGGENLLLLQHGDEAEGTIANHAVGFSLFTTPTGHLMRGSVPAHTTRVEISGRTLSYYPGCDDPLTMVAANTYEGTCGGGKVQVVLPAAWQHLPPLTRLILLSLLLPERDPGLADNPPALFGPPDWPKHE